ncbi:GspE/PulE family protein [Giesbergeria anulus]|uniref:Type II secretory pathway ATPase GspE/PulE or T4P pilus assembly pathway ATPase PilB n=1 Tax=Giesbergeria anulus TaxID=180197 RepID=A0A1H9QBH5_9BURK|nr:ATPase, T2SS/T4P/T4SS family [Giesbergeria anulus]SER57861.1 Type II secretory pathway ATPase GspE/PulE or T4P pilus assembly pathway ATPase PilB [Giesbergeria anulus]
MPATTAPSTLVSAETIHWPAIPGGGYASVVTTPDGLACQMEAINGQVRRLLLVSASEAGRFFLVQQPPARTTMTLRFAMVRKLWLNTPLQPDTATAGAAQPSRFLLTLRHADLVRGQTVGHVENGMGLFLFQPVGGEGGPLECVFYPREAYQKVRWLDDSAPAVPPAPATANPAPAAPAPKESEPAPPASLSNSAIVDPEQLLVALEQQARMPVVRIGEALTTLGLVTREQLAEVLEKQKTERGAPLGEMLVQSGTISREDLQMALVRKMGYPVVDVSRFQIDAESLKKVPFAMAQRLHVLPLLLRPGLLVVAAEDPSLRSTIDALEFLTQSRVLAALASAAQLAELVEPSYAHAGLNTSGGHASGRPQEQAAPASANELRASLEFDSSQEEETIDNAPQITQTDNSLVRLINTMILDAQKQGVSDIHIETYPTKRKIRIRFRRDGVLAPYMELPHTYRSALVARIKIMCELDISERRKPQDGKINFNKFASGHHLELRVATIPTQAGAEDVVLRLLSSAKAVSLQALNLSPPNQRQLTDAIERPYGMVLCVGPTGSGKTTTLHSVLQHLNTPERKIWTAEDPVEITNPDLRQVQVNPKIDWTFAKALRSFLRADPDIIMVGEIRDQETAQIAIEASLTGHMVLSTLHTNSAAETVIRLLDMGMDPFNFADSLLAVLAQRLARQWCQQCKRTEVADEDYIQALLHEYLRSFTPALCPEPQALREDWVRQYGKGGQLLRTHAPGCAHCHHTGLRGRLGLHELLVVGPEVRQCIQQHARPEEIVQAAMAHSHFRTLRQDGIDKVLAGLTSLEEVRANCNG